MTDLRLLDRTHGVAYEAALGAAEHRMREVVARALAVARGAPAHELDERLDLFCCSLVSLRCCFFAFWQK